jgi:hypothetical protein
VAAGIVLLCACATGRLDQIRKTGGAAMSCPGDSLWVLDDGTGWAAAGCGQIASGTDPTQLSQVSAATCPALAQFEYRMCLLVARQRAASMGSGSGNLAAQGMEANDAQACSERLKSRSDTCLRTPPPREAEPPATDK